MCIKVKTSSKSLYFFTLDILLCLYALQGNQEHKNLLRFIRRFTPSHASKTKLSSSGH
jgi:hypothetical protein